MKKALQVKGHEHFGAHEKLSPEATLQFLDEFAKLHSAKLLSQTSDTKSILISMKVPPGLLQAFKSQCQLKGIPYQTQIKKIMREWLLTAAQNLGD